MEITPNPDFMLNNEQSYLDMDFNEYFIIKDNKICKIYVIKENNNIKIQINSYMIIFDHNSSNLSKYKFKNTDEAYEFILKIFENNQFKINNIKSNESIKLVLCPNRDREIELSLLYNKINKNFIRNEIIKLKININELKMENSNLKKDITLLKSYHNNPKYISLLSDISQDSFAHSALDNTFITFKSIYNIYYLIYTTINNSIICFDIEKQKKIRQLKNYHNEFITNFRHYLDEKNKRDLVMSISKDDNNIRVWNAKSWDCILNLNNINTKGWIYSACFLKYNNNQNYIITSNINWEGNSEHIKIYDFNGSKIKELKNSNERTYFIDVFYDKVLAKNYIICGNENYIKSYDLNKNELFHKYHENDNGGHFSIIINNSQNIVKLIDSCEDGNIRIWNFETAALLSKIKVSEECLYGMCLWNTNYLFVGSRDNKIELINLKEGKIVKTLNGHKAQVLTIKKIDYSLYGESLVSQGWIEDQVKIWVNINNC